MQHFYRLRNTVKKYEWGSSEWIPALTGLPNPSAEPWAELWMGAHPASPSIAESDSSGSPLDELVKQYPEAALGTDTAKTFGGLPFLLKLLAAARPLSIQAHPSLEQAKAGWERENAAGIPQDAPNRNYKDANHKPEILCALTPFRAMCGFRQVAEIRRLLDVLALDPFSEARRALDGADDSSCLKNFLNALFGMEEAGRDRLGELVARRVRELAAQNDGNGPLWELIASFAALYPTDPAIVSPLYLNVLDLQPGDAIYLPAGILHAYVSGLGVELMANSDNVLRGGLTPKHIDLGELTRTLRFLPFRPEVLAPVPEDGGLERYATPCREFSLARASSSNGTVRLPSGGPSIVVVIEGTAALAAEGNGNLVLKRGESAFVPAETKGLTLSGNFTSFVAEVGRNQELGS